MNKTKIEEGENPNKEECKIEYNSKVNKKFYAPVVEIYLELNGFNAVMKWNVEVLIGIIYNALGLTQKNFNI